MAGDGAAVADQVSMVERETGGVEVKGVGREAETNEMDVGRWRGAG
jgi:hypothetical protein